MPDVGEARAKLEAAGIEFERDSFDSGVCHMAFFRDSEGNGLMIHHRYAAVLRRLDAVIERVDYIRVPVTDMDAANHFYGELLGLDGIRTRPATTGSSTRPATSRWRS